MKKLHFSNELSLPLDAATQTFAFIARKGAGKTYAAGKLAELLIGAGVQVVVLDTVGNWFGLRLDADGRSKGLDVPVLGGLRGDIPLNAESGSLIADLIVDSGRSLVIDISQFSLGERKRFATSLGEQLWKRKKAEANPSPVHLIIEESQLIIPQFVSRDEARMVGIFEEIIRLGRNYGIGVSMITQRPQSVNKEVLTQTECLVVGQVNGVPERKALKEWIVHQGLDVHLADELPWLPVGTMFVWSPQWLRDLKKVHIAKKQTFDASATPKVGEKRAATRELKPIDLEDLKAKMSATIEQNKANDPRELKKRIAELEKQLHLKQGATDPRHLAATVVRAQQEAQRVWMDEKKTYERELGQLQGKLKKIAALVGDESGINSSEKKANSPLEVTPLKINPYEWGKQFEALAIRQPKALAHHPKSTISHEATNLEVGKGGLRRILIALAQRPGLTNRQIGVRAGLSSSSGTFANYLSQARKAGWIRGEGEKRFITSEGMEALGSYSPLPTGQELLQYWLNELGNSGASRILQVLANSYPHELTYEQIGGEAGMSHQSGTFANYVSKLRTLELIQGTRGLIKASDELFS